MRGEGAYLFDREGKRYLDASGGAAVSCLGHSDPAVLHAVQAQLARLPFAHTSFFSNEPMEALAEALIRRSPRAFEKVYFVTGGSEDTVERWKTLNHAIAVNRVIGFEQRVAMHNRPAHDPTPESNAAIYRFFEHALRAPAGDGKREN